MNFFIVYIKAALQILQLSVIYLIPVRYIVVYKRATSHREDAAAGGRRGNREVEPKHWWSSGSVHSASAVWVVHDLIEEKQRLVVAGVDNWTDLDGQANGISATVHSNVCVL